MGARTRQVVYAMIDHAVELIEQRVPENAALDVAIVRYLRDSLAQPDEAEMAVFRSALQQAVRAVWGLSVVVEAEDSRVEREESTGGRS